MNTALAWFSNLILSIFSAWFTAKKSEETGRSTERADAAIKSTTTIVERIEQKQKVDDAVNRLSPDDRRERLREWSRRSSPKPPDGRNSG